MESFFLLYVGVCLYRLIQRLPAYVFDSRLVQPVCILQTGYLFLPVTVFPGKLCAYRVKLRFRKSDACIGIVFYRQFFMSFRIFQIFLQIITIGQNGMTGKFMFWQLFLIQCLFQIVDARIQQVHLKEGYPLQTLDVVIIHVVFLDLAFYCLQRVV